MEASIILCAYNAKDRISKALDALIKQDCPKKRWELIVVDDASSDATATIIKDALRDVDNAKLIVHKVNKGLGGSRNTGIAQAKGKFIFFTDDDCIPPPHWISEGIRLFKKEPPVVGAIAGDVRIPSYSYIADCIALMGFPAGGNLGFGNMFSVDEKGFTHSFTTANAIARKSVLDELVGPFDESLRKIQDKDLALRIQESGYKIRFRDSLTLIHMPMPSIKSYLQRMKVKGIYGYRVTSKHGGQQRTYSKLRARSVQRILTQPPKRYLPGIIPLLAAGYGVATLHYFLERFRDTINKDPRQKGPE